MADQDHENSIAALHGILQSAADDLDGRARDIEVGHSQDNRTAVRDGVRQLRAVAGRLRTAADESIATTAIKPASREVVPVEPPPRQEASDAFLHPTEPR